MIAVRTDYFPCALTVYVQRPGRFSNDAAVRAEVYLSELKNITLLTTMRQLGGKYVTYHCVVPGSK